MASVSPRSAKVYILICINFNGITHLVQRTLNTVQIIEIYEQSHIQVFPIFVYNFDEFSEFSETSVHVWVKYTWISW